MAGRKFQDSAESLIPEKPTLPRLQEAAANCKACDLWENAAQMSDKLQFVAIADTHLAARDKLKFVGHTLLALRDVP